MYSKLYTCSKPALVTILSQNHRQLLETCRINDPGLHRRWSSSFWRYCWRRRRWYISCCTKKDGYNSSLSTSTYPLISNCSTDGRCHPISCNWEVHTDYTEYQPNTDDDDDDDNHNTDDISPPATTSSSALQLSVSASGNFFKCSAIQMKYFHLSCSTPERFTEKS